MSKIDVGRVLLGGLVAGLVLNIGEYILNAVILVQQWRDVAAQLRLPEPGGEQVPWLIILHFLIGIMMVWFYAAVRPRFGAGPRTALLAGFAVWILLWLLGTSAGWIMGVIPTRALIITWIWGFFEVPISTLAGAWLYSEGPAPADAA